MTKQQFKDKLRELRSDEVLFMNIVFKDGSEMEISDEQLSGTDEDIARGRYYVIDYDSDDSDGEEVEIKITDIADIVPSEDYDDDEDWDEDYDDDDWDDDEDYDDDDWDDEDED